jgi:hypothetical protein
MGNISLRGFFMVVVVWIFLSLARRLKGPFCSEPAHPQLSRIFQRECKLNMHYGVFSAY